MNDVLADYYLSDKKNLISYAHRFLRKPEDTEDAVHTAFYHALRWGNHYDESKPLDAWFKRILRNICMKMRRNPSINLISLENLSDVEKVPEDSSDFYERKRLFSAVKSKINEEKKKLHRDILYLFFIRNFKAIDIHHHFERRVNLSSIHTIVSRFKPILRSLLME